jgi:hypothetical protein
VVEDWRAPQDGTVKVPSIYVISILLLSEFYDHFIFLVLSFKTSGSSVDADVFQWKLDNIR